MLGWSSVVHVRSFEPSNSGAYALMMALADNERDFRQLITAELATLGQLPIDFDNIENFDPTTQVWTDKVAQELNDNLSAEWPVQYRNFHSYPVEEKNV